MEDGGGGGPKEDDKAVVEGAPQDVLHPALRGFQELARDGVRGIAARRRLVHRPVNGPAPSRRLFGVRVVNIAKWKIPDWLRARAVGQEQPQIRQHQ